MLEATFEANVQTSLSSTEVGIAIIITHGERTIFINTGFPGLVLVVLVLNGIHWLQNKKSENDNIIFSSMEYSHANICNLEINLCS